MREEVTVRLSPSVGVTIVAGIVTIVAAFYTQAQDLREEAEQKYTTRIEHRADIDRMRDVADTRFNIIQNQLSGQRETLNRIEDLLSKENER